MNVPMVSVQELVGLVRAGTALRLIDVRSPAEYAAVHADGARLVPLDRLDPASVASAAGGRAGGEGL